MLRNKSYLNLDLTIDSGQVFLWNKVDSVWYGIHRDDVVKVYMENDVVYFYPEYIDYRSIFRLDDDLHNICSNMCKDAVMKDAVSKMQGLRIMRQDPYQCLISFMCATNTSIHMIKHMLGKMCIHFGKKVEYDNCMFHTFPEPETLASASINELCRCSVGYRARFIRRAARAVYDNEIDFNYLRHTNYENAKEELMEVLGVGQKVSDCILLFSLEKTDSFPIDVWIARAIAKYYGHMFEDKIEKITPKAYRTMSSKMRGYFGA